MKIDKMEKYLEEISEGTDFSFTVSDLRCGEVEFCMQGDNPEGEDWFEYLVFKNPETKRELITALYNEVQERYVEFDIEENVLCMLEAKRNGLSRVPGVVDLVKNEQYKENALKEFSEKLLQDIKNGEKY